MALASIVADAPPIEVRTTYAPGSHCPTSVIQAAACDDVVTVEGDMRSHGLAITHRKAYERRGVLVTDMVTGRYGTDHVAIVREVTESMATQPVQLGWAA